ncbi:MAG: radical SAM protein, partial [Candidatus Nanoarchaeia archaeon]
REAFKLEDFARSPKEIKNVMSTIITSRGCPYECSFCASQKTGYRFRSADNVLKEIRQVKERYGVNNFYLIDDTINVNSPRLLELSKKLKDEHIQWRCNGRFDLFSEELLVAMKEAGCIHISIGVESGDNAVLERMHKRLNTDIIKEKAKLIHKVGIGLTVNFMFGFPFETAENIDNTIKLIKAIEPYVSDFQRAGILIPFPGTTLYEEFKQGSKYDKWWLRPNDFMSEVRESDYRPLYKKFLFDDLGLLDKGTFFDYSEDVKKKIREGMRVIDQIVMRRKAKTLNFTKFKVMNDLIYGGMNAFVFTSKLLYNINPKVERKIIHPMYYRLRRSKYYLKNKTY